jgi:hypothetical protein
MNHDRTFASNRLRGIADQAARGDLDPILADVNPPLAACLRAVLAQRARQIADALDEPPP